MRGVIGAGVIALAAFLLCGLSFGREVFELEVPLKDFARISHQGEERLLLKVDLSRLPDDVVIHSAKLMVPVDRMRWKGGKFLAFAFPLRSDWDAGGVSWTSTGRGRVWENSGGDYEYLRGVSSVVDAVKGGMAVFPVEELLRDWVRGKERNHGILIKFERGDVSSKVASNELKEGKEEPILAISFEVLGDRQ